MSAESFDFVETTLTSIVGKLATGAKRISDLKRLTGGASLETWAFDAIGPEGKAPLILRRRGGGHGEAFDNAVPLPVEAQLICAAHTAGVPVAEVVHCCTDADGLGEAYIMRRVSGEALGQRIARDDRFAPARAVLGGQSGRALAGIHSIHEVPGSGLPTHDAKSAVAQYRAIWEQNAPVRPVIEMAFAWLDQTAPQTDKPVLVHGDFRNGNLMVDAQDGLRAVLDWELAHYGDPAEDFGWLCCGSWRFGNRARRAGGFADLVDVIAAYEAAGEKAPPMSSILWWEALASLKWGVITQMMYKAGIAGIGNQVERMVIGRRLSECEADLVALMDAA